MNEKLSIITSKAILGDYYWDYADIMRSLGIKEAVYDERILGFMSLKLLIDNNKLSFNFFNDSSLNDNSTPFNCKKEDIIFNNENIIDYRETFKNIIKNIEKYDTTNYFYKRKNINENEQWKLWNLNKYKVDNEIEIIKDSKIFDFEKYIDELLEEEKFLAVLNIYNTKANFKGYPKHKYKDLYELTVTRMKKLSGSLTGQHFTQNCIIDLMTEIGCEHINKKQEKVVIFDPACGVGSMLYESATYANKVIYNKNTDSDNNDIDFNNFLLLGQEINGPTWFMAKVFSEISGFENFIAFGNTLTEPFINEFNGNIDFIIANPPFGMDWKTEEKNIRNIIENNVVLDDEKNIVENNSPYKVFKKDKKDWYVLPKISDGQFLFFMQILKLQEKHKGKALVISSTSPASNGKNDSSEGIIRRGMIENGYVDTIFEQPNNMFTNTDIKTHIWVLNSLDGRHKKQINNIKLIQIDNDKINTPFTNNKGKILKKLQLLYSNSDNRIEKQKYGYTTEDIQNLLKLYNEEINFKMFVQNIKYNKDSDYTIDFNIFNSSYDELVFNCDFLSIENINLIQEYLMLSVLYNIGNDELTNKINKYITKELFSEYEYFNRYNEIYKGIFKNNNVKITFDIFKENFINMEKEMCNDITQFKNEMIKYLNDFKK